MRGIRTFSHLERRLRHRSSQSDFSTATPHQGVVFCLLALAESKRLTKSIASDTLDNIAEFRLAGVLTMQRRVFLKHAALTAASGVAVSATSTTDAAPSPGVCENAQRGRQMPPIVDTHVHLWDLNRFQLPWLEKNSPLARSHVMKDYQTAI